MNNYFQAIKKKLAGQKQNAIVFYGDGTLLSGGPGERGDVPAGSLKGACKRHFLTRSANEHRMSRSCIHCKQQEMMKVQHHASANAVSLYLDRQWVHKDKVGVQNIRRSSISNAKGRDRPLDLRKPLNER
jgi:hypothetical protein